MVWIDNMNLKHMVLIKVATQLWKHAHTSDDFQKKFRISGEKWRLLEDICLENIDKLPLPSILRIKIKKIIKPIGIEIVKFNHNRIGIIAGNDYIQQKPVELFWTLRGTVDTKRTFQELIDDECLDLSFRYRLACQCCLENDISVHWDQMSEEQKFKFTHIETAQPIHNWSTLRIIQKSFKEFACKRDFSGFYENAFIQSAKDYNKDAVEFFWNKLPAEKRNIALPKLLEEIKYNNSCGKLGSFLYHACDCSEVILFILTQADRKLIGGLEQTSISRLVNTALKWPCQEHFLDILDSFQLYVGSSEFNRILLSVLNKICFGFQDYDYGLLLKGLLKQESKFEIQCDRPIFPSSFDILHYFRYDSKSVSLIASYCKSKLKKNVTSSQDIFENLSDDEEWKFLTFVLDECILKNKQKIFRLDYKVPFKSVNYRNIKSRVERSDCYDFLCALTREKTRCNHIMDIHA